MVIHRFFAPELFEAPDGLVELPEAEGRHAVKVLRLRPGDDVLLLDGRGGLGEAELAESSRDGRRVVCRIGRRWRVPSPSRRWHLHVALPHGKAADLVFRMATELGFWRMTPIICQYSVARPTDISGSWAAILQTACKQSVNPWMPELSAPLPFDAALAAAPPMGFYGAVPGDCRPSMPQCPADDGDFSLWIGPEGGFSPNECEALAGHGLAPLTVGGWTLRVETAVAALGGCVMRTGSPNA